jgi:hypothetical protein
VYHIVETSALWTNIAYLGLEDYLYSLEDSSDIGIKNDRAYILEFVSHEKFKITSIMDAVRVPFYAVIRKVSQAPFVHAGLSLDKDIKTFYHVLENGVNIQALATWADHKIKYIDVFEYPITSIQKQAMQKLLDYYGKQKTRYAFKPLFKILFNLIHRDYQKLKFTIQEARERTAFICSDFVATVMGATIKSFRQEMGNKAHAINAVSPKDLTTMSGVKFFRRLDAATKKTVSYDGGKAS